MNKKSILIPMILIIGITVCFCGCTQSADTTMKAGSLPQKDDLSATLASEPAMKTYIVGIDGEYPPYSYIDKSGTPQGLDVESIKWIGEEMGFLVKIQPIAWDGIIPALNAGKIDMVYSGMTITEERKQQVNFSNPYLKINQSVARHDDNTLTFEDFMAGKAKIGAQRGTTGAFWVEENLIKTKIIPAEQLVTYDNFPLVATDLQNKRIDFAIYDLPPMRDAIAGKPLSIIGEIDTGEEYGVAIRKTDVELLNTINSGLEILIQSPKWEELLVKYEME
jgi:polar amino acid transport system substrate-binding protein